MKTNHANTFKKCSKCLFEFANHIEFYKLTRFVGVMDTSKYSDFNLELRNCKCGSTLSHKSPKNSRDSGTPDGDSANPEQKIA